jgi:inorganic pyrophosphatase
MQSAFNAMPPRDPETGLVHVVIDTPRGSRNKYKFDETLGCFRLSRILPAGHAFPWDFGSIPGTRAEDGDALDVLVLLDAASFPGCLITVQLIGVLAARQTQAGRTIRNDRLVAVPHTPVNPPEFGRLGDLPPRLLDEIAHFFVSYNQAQGRRFEPLERLGPDAAEAMLTAAIAANRDSERKAT